jgi:hypothetical protein
MARQNTSIWWPRCFGFFKIFLKKKKKKKKKTKTKPRKPGWACGARTHMHARTHARTVGSILAPGISVVPLIPALRKYREGRKTRNSRLPGSLGAHL